MKCDKKFILLSDSSQQARNVISKMKEEGLIMVYWTINLCYFSQLQVATKILREILH